MGFCCRGQHKVIGVVRYPRVEAGVVGVASAGHAVGGTGGEVVAATFFRAFEAQEKIEAEGEARGVSDALHLPKARLGDLTFFEIFL